MISIQSVRLFSTLVFVAVIFEGIQALPSNSGGTRRIIDIHSESSKVIMVNTTRHTKIIKSGRAGHKTEGFSSGSESKDQTNCFNTGIPELSKTQEEFNSKLTQEKTYIPFASTNYFTIITMILNGEALDVVDMDKLCVRRSWDITKDQLNIFGLGKTAVLKCNSNPISSAATHCKSEGEPQVSWRVLRVWTDSNLKYLLVVGCLSHGEKFWYVVSEQTKVGKVDRQSILQEIVKFGFSAAEAVEPSYSKCDKDK